MAISVPTPRPASAYATAAQSMKARSRSAVNSEMKPPSVSSGPGANWGKNMAATGAANIAKPMPRTPCASAAPNTTSAMAA
ncbi:hypothetical protein G6F65_023386 [Rhizopus arrhizus]|nr:hypothetical protein G6F65_023386 [Rhizopus arrhizus]